MVTVKCFHDFEWICRAPCLLIALLLCLDSQSSTALLYCSACKDKPRNFGMASKLDVGNAKANHQNAISQIVFEQMDCVISHLYGGGMSQHIKGRSSSLGPPVYHIHGESISSTTC